MNANDVNSDSYDYDEQFENKRANLDSVISDKERSI